jgi:hypothetical protein
MHCQIFVLFAWNKIYQTVSVFACHYWGCWLSWDIFIISWRNLTRILFCWILHGEAWIWLPLLIIHLISHSIGIIKNILIHKPRIVNIKISLVVWSSLRNWCGAAIFRSFNRILGVADSVGLIVNYLVNHFYLIN